jgi:hypothetical protein
VARKNSQQAKAQPARMSDQQLTRLAALVTSDEGPGRYLSDEERASLDRAQQSVAESRRRAELYEGNLQVF